MKPAPPHLLPRAACSNGLNSRCQLFEMFGRYLRAMPQPSWPKRHGERSARHIPTLGTLAEHQARNLLFCEGMATATVLRRSFVPALMVFVLLLLPARATSSRAQANTQRKQQPAQAQDNKADFAAAADEVLADMSEITGLKLRSPLKKSLRSRDEIRSYVIRQMNEEKKPAERYASARSAEAFGLLPKEFDLDAFMIELLTEQIAGLYDPKSHEFYVADWIPIEDQRMVMAHELTHALEDQHFQIEQWAKAARPDDDAELAREAVLEGSAMAAMVEYLLQGTGRSLADLPDIDPSLFVGDLTGTPTLKKAPPFLKDALMFPYVEGLKFSAVILKPNGWSALPGVFSKPPASTQQIMHPALYRSGKNPASVSLPSMDKSLGSGWSRLEESDLGEFGWKEVLKTLLGEDRAEPLAAAWDGDRYASYQQKKSKQVLLIARLRLDSEEQTEKFFSEYSQALEKKHQNRTKQLRRSAFLSFDTPDGGVFLRCATRECVSLEGGDRAVFVQLNKDLGWAALP